MWKTILHTISFLLLATIVGCGRSKTKDSEPIDQHNFIILLDLSDRLIKDGRGQVENDKKIIFEIWKQYREITKKKIYIKSRDIFQVVLADQDSSSLQENAQRDFQDSLVLDLSMGKLHAGNKKKIVGFESKLKSQLNDLYSQASRYTNPDDYRGGDIWKFFNEDLSYRLKKGYKNHVYIITDGYLFVKEQRKEIADAFPPVNYILNGGDLNICMLEIAPKIKTDHEFDRLKSVWSNWYMSMGIKEMCFLKRNNLSFIEDEIFDFLNSMDRKDYAIKKSDNIKKKELALQKNDKQVVPVKIKSDSKFSSGSNGQVNKLLTTSSNRQKREVQQQVKTHVKKSNLTNQIVPKSDAEFLAYYITSGIYDNIENSKESNLSRIKNILEYSFPSKESENFILLCSCKSKLKSQLSAQNMLSEELKNKLNTRCP